MRNLIAIAIVGSVLYEGKYYTAEDGPFEISRKAFKTYEEHGRAKEYVMPVFKTTAPAPAPPVAPPAVQPAASVETSLEEYGFEGRELTLLTEAGIKTVEQLDKLDFEGLVALEGIGDVTANAILEMLETEE